MPTITLSVPEDLKHEMDESKFINWSEVAREAIREKVAQLRVLNAIAAKSKLTEKDAIEIGRRNTRKKDGKWNELLILIASSLP